MIVRYLVAVAIILPLYFVLAGPWYVIFSIAVFGFGTGRAVEHLLAARRRPAGEPRPPGWVLPVVALGAAVVTAALLALGVALTYQRQAAVDHLLDQRLQVTLPTQLDHGEPALELVVAGEDRFLLGSDTLDEAQLRARLGQLPPGTTLSLSASADVPYELVVRAVDLAHSAGVTDVTLGD